MKRLIGKLLMKLVRKELIEVVKAELFNELEKRVKNLEEHGSWK